MFDSLDRVVEKLRNGERFLVIGHISPDGDAVGSVASLVMILKELGKEVEGCIADELPDFVGRISKDEWIKGVDDLRDYSYDTAITVDSSDLARIGSAADLLAGRRPDITLDHHKSNIGFGEINFCDPSCAATAMIVYEIGLQLVEINTQMAQMLLMGIATDTGFFRYSSVDARVFTAAAALVNRGANIGHISEAILEHRTLNEIRLQTAMFDTLKITCDGRLATAYVTNEMIVDAGCTDEDTSGLVGQIRAIGGVEVAIVFIEWPHGTVHVSMRSKDAIDVSKIALQFGGGGHARAAGCSVEQAKPDELIAKVSKAMEGAIREAFSY